MTAKEVYVLIEELKQIFDVVRLVDADITEVCHVSEDGTMVHEPLRCFKVWKKDQRCTNCISARLCPEHSRIEKYEFVDQDIYHITSKLVEVEGRSYALEVVSKTSDDTLFEAYGKDQFVQAIERMNRKMYVDSMTGAYNRRYYDEQVLYWKQVTALAVIDIDNFKTVNDTYGHLTGDEALKGVAAVLQAHVRSQDAVVRYGGDEFLMVFTGISEKAFAERIEDARAAVTRICLEVCPGLQLTVSIGGYFTEEPCREMFQRADKALYQAKKVKNRVEMITAEAF